MIDGTPARFAIERRITVMTGESRLYSLRNTALMTPSGSAITRAPAARRNVPTMHGQMPPSLIMLRGASVKNSQVMAGMAFQKMTPSIETSESTHTRAAPRITVKPARPERLRILRSFIMRS